MRSAGLYTGRSTPPPHKICFEKIVSTWSCKINLYGAYRHEY